MDPSSEFSDPLLNWMVVLTSKVDRMFQHREQFTCAALGVVSLLLLGQLVASLYLFLTRAVRKPDFSEESIKYFREAIRRRVPPYALGCIGLTVWGLIVQIAACATGPDGEGNVEALLKAWVSSQSLREE